MEYFDQIERDISLGSTYGLATFKNTMPVTSGAKWNGYFVRNIQTALSSLGFSTKGVDGVYGSNTRAAVTAFQRAMGIGVDGNFGSQTANAVISRLKPLEATGGNYGAWILAFGGKASTATYTAPVAPPQSTPYIPSQPSPVTPKPVNPTPVPITPDPVILDNDNSMTYILAAVATFGVMFLLRKRKKKR